MRLPPIPIGQRKKSKGACIIMIPDLSGTFLRVLELILTRKQARKDRFLNKIVEPMFEDFRIVHQHYVENLWKFRKLIEEDAEDLRSIVDRIRQERRFSEAERSEIRAFVREHSDKANSQKAGGDVLEFCCELRDYLSDPQFDMMVNMYEQRWYNCLGDALEKLNQITPQPPEVQQSSDRSTSPPDGPRDQHGRGQELERILREVEGDSKAAAIRTIDIMVDEMQLSYERICDAYARLKTHIAE